MTITRGIVGIAMVCLAAAFAPSTVAAQPTKEEKIRELLEISQTETLLQQVLPILLKHSRDLVSKGHPDIPEEVWELTFGEAEAAFMESIEGFIEQAIPIYDRNLSEEEVDGLLGFYRTPVGRSVVSKLPQVMQESMIAGQSWGRAVGAQIHRRVIETLKDEGYEI